MESRSVNLEWLWRCLIKRKQKGTEKYTIWVKIKQDENHQRVHVCVCTCAWVYMWVHVCMSACACVYMYVRVHVRARMWSWREHAHSYPDPEWEQWLPLGEGTGSLGWKRQFIFPLYFCPIWIFNYVQMFFKKNRGRHVGLVINLEIKNFLNFLFNIRLFKNIWDKTDGYFSGFLFEE